MILDLRRRVARPPPNALYVTILFVSTALHGHPASPAVTRWPNIAAICSAKRVSPSAKSLLVAHRIASTSPGSDGVRYSAGMPKDIVRAGSNRCETPFRQSPATPVAAIYVLYYSQRTKLQRSKIAAAPYQHALLKPEVHQRRLERFICERLDDAMASSKILDLFRWQIHTTI